jgi:hypothetical protein
MQRYNEFYKNYKIVYKVKSVHEVSYDIMLPRSTASGGPFYSEDKAKKDAHETIDDWEKMAGFEQ